MEKTKELDEKQTYIENIKKRVEESNVNMLSMLLDDDQLKKRELDPSSKEIIEAKKILSSLQQERDAFINSLKSYFINENFWNYLDQTSYTAASGPLGKAVYVYLQKLHDHNKKFDKTKQLEYVKQNTICNIMYWFFSRKINDFTDIYPSFSLAQLKETLDKDPNYFSEYANVNNFHEHWESKPKEWMLTPAGKSHKRNNIDFNTRRNSHWGSAGDVNAGIKLKIGRNNKPTKLGNPDTLREELYCHYYKFWNHNIDTKCFNNKKCVNNCIFGYLGKECLKRLSQHLTQDDCPVKYPVRTYANLTKTFDTDTDNVLQQAIDSINYLLGNDDDNDDQYVKLPVDSINLETVVNQVSNDNKINICILDATNACNEASIEWTSEEIVMNIKEQAKYTETIFIYVYRGIKGIEFVEPIIFIPINTDIIGKVIKKIENHDQIVKNLTVDLPECGIDSTYQPIINPIIKKPLLDPPSSIGDDVPSINIDTPPSFIEGTSQMAYYNINDIGQALPIVEIGIDRIKYLLGNEYGIDIDQIKYRNLYGPTYPYNLVGRLSGNIQSSNVMIGWLKSDKLDDKPLDVTSPSSHASRGGGNTIYECLSKNSSVNRTPFYSILESSIY